jgi:hypothetical protein
LLFITLTFLLLRLVPTTKSKIAKASSTPIFPSYARIDKSKGEDSVVKIATTGIKITNKIRKIKGKLTKEKLKKIFKDEGIDIADDLTTLVDGKIGVDDACCY